jgi:YfiH family protein
MTNEITSPLFDLFGDHPDLVATISKKTDGNCYGGLTGYPDVDTATPANRNAFIARHNIQKGRLVSAALVHGGAVHFATTQTQEGGTMIPATDALFAHERNLFLSITTADCLPVFFFDPITKTFGLAHAGWRGLVAGIIPNTIRAMTRESGVRPENLLVGIGPGIGACHFEVQDDVAKQFAIFPDAVVRRGDGAGALFIDLKAVAREQLLAAEIKATHLEISNECTYDLKDKYFSWRRDKPAAKETMMAVIGLREAN